ncbi:hypothetical protein Dsin_016451 [Dipteronia sinensis]|uniref:Uncharacterized protein n=1 Tax=Dipteronia sinensis TaxID=43782 RepID=A0AAE0E604_9ROSI|nr:hypothetical protein Dsin_016451 [Dipteronia sinensis]
MKCFTAVNHSEVSLAGRQLINALLNRDPACRLDQIPVPMKSNSILSSVKLNRCMIPPPLYGHLELIGKDLKAMDVSWEDDGVLVNSTDMENF